MVDRPDTSAVETAFETMADLDKSVLTEYKDAVGEFNAKIEELVSYYPSTYPPATIKNFLLRVSSNMVMYSSEFNGLLAQYGLIQPATPGLMPTA